MKGKRFGVVIVGGTGWTDRFDVIVESDFDTIPSPDETYPEPLVSSFRS